MSLLGSLFPIPSGSHKRTVFSRIRAVREPCRVFCNRIFRLLPLRVANAPLRLALRDSGSLERSQNSSDDFPESGPLLTPGLSPRTVHIAQSTSPRCRLPVQVAADDSFPECHFWTQSSADDRHEGALGIPFATVSGNPSMLRRDRAISLGPPSGLQCHTTFN
jgi:hypothetical protein